MGVTTALWISSANLPISWIRDLPSSDPLSIPFRVLQFVLDHLLELARICPHNSPSIYKQRGRAVDVHHLAIGDVRVHGSCRLRAGHASFEVVRLEPGPPGIVEGFVPGVRR